VRYGRRFYGGFDQESPRSNHDNMARFFLIGLIRQKAGQMNPLEVSGVGAMKRNRQDIIYDILTICLRGANKTKIVYEGNLNFRTTNHYLNDLVKNQFINIEQGEYCTTQRGVSLLESMNQVNAKLYGSDKIQTATS